MGGKGKRHTEEDERGWKGGASRHGVRVWSAEVGEEESKSREDTPSRCATRGGWLLLFFVSSSFGSTTDGGNDSSDANGEWRSSYGIASPAMEQWGRDQTSTHAFMDKTGEEEDDMEGRTENKQKSKIGASTSLFH